MFKKKITSKIMSPEESIQFINCCHRAETGNNPILYTKAIRASLIALGYDESWVNDEFRTLIENEWKYEFDEFCSR